MTTHTRSGDALNIGYLRVNWMDSFLDRLNPVKERGYQGCGKYFLNQASRMPGLPYTEPGKAAVELIWGEDYEYSCAYFGF